MAPAAAVPGPVAAPGPSPTPDQTLDSFSSNGDQIFGWYWLGDSAGQHYAQWVFRNTADEGPFQLEMEMLATNQGDGGSGYPARFWLTYGPVGDGGLYPSGAEPLFVELPNVSPPTDPFGYKTQGTVTLALGALPAHTDGIWVRITRRVPGGGPAGVGGTGTEPFHISVTEDSITIAGTPDCDPLADDAAEAFTSDGDLVSGWYWLDDTAGQQYGQWVFRNTINQGAFELNLHLLASNTFGGGPGYPAHFWLTYGAVYEHGLGPAADDPLLVELPNVSPLNDPVGYTTRGSVTLGTGSLPSSTDGIWVQIARVRVDGSSSRGGTSGAVQPYHIAVNEASVTIRGTRCGFLNGSNGSLPPDISSMCSASGMSPVPVAQELPAAVAETRRQIIEAAVGCNYEALASLASSADYFAFSLDQTGTPAEYWQSMEQSGGQPLRSMVMTLSLHPEAAGVGGTEGAFYLWSDGAGGVTGYRLGISAEGQWLFFLATGSTTTTTTTTTTTSTTSTTSTTTTVPDPSLEDLPPMVISLGDSYISGEAGRWAGNPPFLLGYPFTDALGDSAYGDGPGFSETIAGCHRSRSAAIHIGQAEDGTSVTSVNLACSGARTYTQPGKPGLDCCTNETSATGSNRVRWIANSLYTNPYPCSGVTGQVELLRQTMAQAAGLYHVKMVVVSIGGNNFEFGEIVEQCVWNFLTMRDFDPGSFCAWRDPFWGGCLLWVPSLFSKDLCSDDAVADNVTDPRSLEARELEIAMSLWDIIDVMEDAGYTADDWTLLVNTYPSPIPDSDGFRYIETGWDRHSEGGCGFWDEDADWANATALPNITATVKNAVVRIEAPNARVLDVSQAFVGRRLCEEGVHKVGLVSAGASSWTQWNAVDLSEWVQEIRGVLSQGGAIDVPPFYADESFHPNYWGQLALRSCVRQAYNNGDPLGGRCVRIGNGLSGRGEPRMDVVP